MLKLDVQTTDATALASIFGGGPLMPGAEVDLGHGARLVNMTAGADNVTAQEFVTLVVEYADQVDAFIVGGVVYDVLKSATTRILARGREVVSGQEIGEQIDRDTR